MHKKLADLPTASIHSILYFPLLCSILHVQLCLYSVLGALYCAFQLRGWDWVVYLSHSIAKKLQKLRLILYLLFYNRPPAAVSDDTHCHSIRYVYRCVTASAVISWPSYYVWCVSHTLHFLPHPSH